MRPIFNGRKTRLLSAGAGVIALAIPATAAALTVGPLSTSTGARNVARSSAVTTTRPRYVVASSAAHARHCRKLFTPRMGKRAALVIYRGTRHVTMANYRTLGNIERCQRNPSNQPRVRRFDRHQAALHKARVRRQARAQAGWRWPWSCIAKYESGGNPAENTGNGFYGGLQFTMSTWRAYGGSGNPANASIAKQEAVAQRVLAAQGWGAWPNTSRMCGL
jgi:hypothetical protein